ncbi:Zn-ribbon domain-containing OB-fold protein [Halobaculum magnesiiphilum]|uniref:OB-fold domain-containing protein n=1 Tax=Halobaculum magnesiiphilum TaxID=1017351 RepID=A0A8T8WC10_9EURY|nr:OB-fold domain-containing protein [Halobaculum magnesiiphilum]QZP37293.1 OB-fold domain-containing protein [Halobaculum magnesiiphilum]
MSDPDPDAPADTGYDEWADALAEGGYYIECANGHGNLPPRRVCPDCGSTDLSEEPLPDVGAVATFSEVHVAPSGFGEEPPYVTAVVDFGPVRVTGIVRELSADEIEIGTAVRPDVEHNDATDKRLVVFRPA